MKEFEKGVAKRKRSICIILIVARTYLENIICISIHSCHGKLFFMSYCKVCAWNEQLLWHRYHPGLIRNTVENPLLSIFPPVWECLRRIFSYFTNVPLEISSSHSVIQAYLLS